MRVQKSVEIAALPEKVWSFLVEPEKILKWCTTFIRFEYTSEQHSGPGAHVYVEEKAGGPVMKINFAVTEWVKNEKLTLKMTSGSGVKSYKIMSTLEPSPSGSIYTFVEEVEFSLGIIGKFIGFIGKGVANKHINEYLSGLKKLVEA